MRTWSGQMKQGFNNPYGDLNGFGSGGGQSDEDADEEERWLNQSVANINKYKRQINEHKTNLNESKKIGLCLSLVLKKTSQNKQIDLSQKEVDARYKKYFNILSNPSTTNRNLEEKLNNICQLNY